MLCYRYKFSSMIPNRQSLKVQNFKAMSLKRQNSNDYIDDAKYYKSAKHRSKSERVINISIVGAPGRFLNPRCLKTTQDDIFSPSCQFAFVQTIKFVFLLKLINFFGFV